MEQRTFLMSQKELLRYHVIDKTIEGRMSNGEAAERTPSKVEVSQVT